MRSSKKIRQMPLDALIVRELIPTSSFTKTGPGVRANLREAYDGMVSWQRKIAVERGWVPPAWGEA